MMRPVTTFGFASLRAPLAGTSFASLRASLAPVLARVAVVAALGAVSTPAWALSCDEIMNMVNVNVPSNIVVQTMESSGTKFSSSEVACLVQHGAPADVVAAAKRLGATETAPPPTTPSGGNPPTGGSDFDSESTLGGDTTTSPSESGSDSAPDASGPQQIEELIKLYKAKKYLTASKGFYDLLQDNTFPDEESKIDYYLARSLYDLQMYHSAQHYFMEVVRKGPKNPYFKYALPKLVLIAQLTGDDSELMRIVDKIPPDQFPREAKNHLFYLMGRKLYEEDKLAEASKYFEQVSPKSDLGLKAKYYEGVIDNERGKLKSAVKAFKEVYQSDVTPTDDKQIAELEDLKDLSLMNIARIYYGIEKFDEADNFYGLVARDSTYWPQSLYERAWTNFLRNDLNLTLGLLLTVRSPYYSDEEYIPEAQILRGITFFQLCDQHETEGILNDFDARYPPMRDEMKTFLDQYNTEDGRKLSDQAFDQYFTNPHKGSTLTKAFFLRVLRNRDLADLVKHMQMLDDEITAIDAQKGVWKDTLGAKLKETIADDRARYKRKAGLVLINEVQTQYDYLNDLVTQSQIIRFESVDAQRKDYEYKMVNPEVESQESKKVDFATSKDIIYWPFNGEFWQDELGYYRYSEESKCNAR
jgi:TolA-binding protein